MPKISTTRREARKALEELLPICQAAHGILSAKSTGVLGALVVSAVKVGALPLALVVVLELRARGEAGDKKAALIAAAWNGRI